MSFTHHIMARTSVRDSVASGHSAHHTAPGVSGDGSESDDRISLCRGCYEGRGDHTLYLPRRKARRCAQCADRHESDTCFLAKCVFCGEDAIAPRRDGLILWFACEKHQYFSFHPDKWKPLPLSRDEKRAIHIQKLRRAAGSLRRALLGFSAIAILYFLFFRATLRDRYDFDVIDMADSAWSGVADFFSSIIRIGTDIAQGL